MKFWSSILLSSLLSVFFVNSYLEPLRSFIDIVKSQGNYRSDNPYIEEKYFTQDLTHTDDDDGQWEQRYFVNYQYYRPGGPAFLFLGGEGYITEKHVTYCLLTEAAKKHNGVIFALEHRFYGKSMPKKSLSIENLAYLNTELILDDISTFRKDVRLPKIKGFNDTEFRSDKTKWIVGGGSYAGTLAAWARLWYPEDFVGAIASSAPVLAKEDFFEYELQVQKSLKKNSGRQCLDYYFDITKKIDDIIKDSDQKKKDDLKKKFGCEGVDDIPFVDSLTILSTIVQRSIRGDSQYDVTEHCNSLSLGGTNTDKLNNFIKKFKEHLKNKGETCQEMANLTNLRNKTIEFGREGRQWQWQTCTEYGFFQTAPQNGVQTTRSTLLTVDYYREYYCKGVFGSRIPNRPDVEKINKRYEGQEMYSSNILFVNGELDPWQPLSIYKENPGKMDYLNIPGASHGRDSTIKLPLDTPEISYAKDKVLDYIANLLKK